MLIVGSFPFILIFPAPYRVNPLVNYPTRLSKKLNFNFCNVIKTYDTLHHLKRTSQISHFYSPTHGLDAFSGV